MSEPWRRRPQLAVLLRALLGALLWLGLLLGAVAVLAFTVALQTLWVVLLPMVARPDPYVVPFAVLAGFAVSLIVFVGFWIVIGLVGGWITARLRLTAGPAWAIPGAIITLSCVLLLAREQYSPVWSAVAVFAAACVLIGQWLVLRHRPPNTRIQQTAAPGS